MERLTALTAWVRVPWNPLATKVCSISASPASAKNRQSPAISAKPRVARRPDATWRARCQKNFHRHSNHSAGCLSFSTLLWFVSGAAQYRQSRIFWERRIRLRELAEQKLRTLGGFDAPRVNAI